MLSVNVGRGNFSSFEEDDELLAIGWADCVWRESRVIKFSHVGTPCGVAKEHPGAVQDKGAGGAIINNILVPGCPRQMILVQNVCLISLLKRASLSLTTLCKSRH